MRRGPWRSILRTSKPSARSPAASRSPVIPSADRLYTELAPLDPAPVAALAGFLMNANYALSDSAAVLERHCQFELRYGRSLSGVSHANGRDAQRRLRVGYVSADLGRHSVACFIEPVLACHERAHFEVHCYFNHGQGDEVTRRLRG